MNKIHKACNLQEIPYIPRYKAIFYFLQKMQKKFLDPKVLHQLLQI